MATLLLIINTASGQDNVFRTLNQRDGLSTGYINSIIQDNNGIIWLTTNRGISSFDGFKVNNYYAIEENPNSITGGGAYKMIQYDDHTLLIGSFSGFEILDLKTNKIRLVKVPDDLPQPTSAHDFEIIDSTHIYVATDVGVFHYPELPTSTNDVRPELFPYKSELNNVGSVLRINLEYDDKDTMWISTGTKLIKLNVKDKSLTEINSISKEIQTLFNTYIWSIYISKNEDLLFSTVDGLVIWRKGEDKPEIIESIGNFSSEEIRLAGFQSITEGKDGSIILGTARMGAWIWNPDDNSVHTIRHEEKVKNSIQSDDVHYAFVDNQLNTWFGHHNAGISIMSSNTISYDYHLLDNTLNKNDPSNTISNFLEDKNNNVWFTTGNGLVKKSTDGSIRRYLTDNSNTIDNAFMAAYELDDEKLLVLRDSLKTFYSFNLDLEEFTKLSPDSSRVGLNLNKAEDSTHFYFGGLDGRIIKINKSDYSVSYLTIPYPENYVPPIKPVMPYNFNDNELAIFSAQLELGGPPNFKVHRYNIRNDSLSLVFDHNPDFLGFGVPVKSRFEDNVFWMRLDNGILKINFATNDYELLFTDDAAIINLGNFLVEVVEDDEGFLWVVLQSAVVKLDPDTEALYYYDLDLDKQPTTFLKGGKLSNGHIIYAGDGYIEFNPKELRSDELIQNVHITEFNSGNEIYEVMYDNEDITLDYAENNLTLSFIGLNYADPAATKYRYRIKGFTDDWINIGTQNQVFLANMPSGNFSFEVQAAPRFGGYSKIPASINFKILPPWWKTWPAYILYAFILISSFFIFDRFQRQRVIAKERERTRDKELKQAKEIEIAYENLKATQKKLIQSEKMASLGELTAGIAHEIQNPLNFVNNFAEINQELAQELEEELNNGEIDEAKAIAKDIVQNEQKILHHGKRADSIVKGMLQHSRNNSGEKELADINVLCDEYLRLAYHGLRAKDKSFNATLETDFDNSLNKISIVPQDIGRVILNIINNALHAIKAKQKSLQDSSYNPTIWVKTVNEDDKVVVEVRDNGNGISEKVKDKIFQPFFTTKSAGEGTGLGLSMSYDIIRAHEGELKVDSKEGEGTTFIIELPKG